MQERNSHDSDRTRIDIEEYHQVATHLDLSQSSQDKDRLPTPSPRMANSHKDNESIDSEPFPGQDSLHGEALGASQSTTLAKDDVEAAEEQQKKDEEVRREKMEQEQDPNLVTWDGPDDPENPMNWPTRKKWLVTVIMGLMTFCVTFASSVFSTATVVVAEVYGVSEEVAVLGTSLFVLGFGVGPLVCVSSYRITFFC
jgi:DHA1 family multidrug resistance protein-like MFS transporter